MKQGLILLPGVLLAFPSAQARTMSPVAVTLAPLTLCEAPAEVCVPRTFIPSDVQRNQGEAKDSHPRTKEMSLPKGDPVEVLASDQSGQWLKVAARYCLNDCKETYSGWLKRSDIAYLSQFQRMRSWLGEREFQIQAGDYADVFKLGADGRFKTNNGSGAMFSYKDIVWARLNKHPARPEYIFIPVAAEGKHCWTMEPQEGKLGAERWNCFSLQIK